MIGKHVKNFKVLPLKFSESSTSAHEIFIKEHSSRQESVDKPKDRTLFVLNIPPYASKDSLKHVFSKAGPVENVLFNNENTQLNPPSSGFKNGYVIFEKPTHLLKAMKLTSLEPLSALDRPITCGLKNWAKEYNLSVPDATELQNEVKRNMLEFDKQVELRKQKDQEEKETDADGWTVVTKSSRNQGLARKKSLENKIKEKMENNKKKKELTNFYTFQIRQSKMKHLANLRKKFEEDKKKIESLKQARRFRPY